MAWNKKVAVLYHKGCRDGFGAAWAAWKKFGVKAEYIGVNHDEPPPQNLKGKEIYLLDFCYPLEITKKLLKIVQRLTVIDHHINMKKSMKLAHSYSYDIEHSGAVLAWKYFHPQIKIPTLLKYIEDVDIWNMKLPNTRELAAALETYDKNFLLWNNLARRWESSDERKQYLNEGKAIFKYQNALVKKAIKDSEEVKFFGHRALAVNFTLSLNSEIGDAMRKKGFPLGIIWQHRAGRLIISLRSSNKIDSSKIAMRFGGGGHKRASAFRLTSKEKLPWKKIKN